MVSMTSAEIRTMAGKELSLAQNTSRSKVLKTKLKPLKESRRLPTIEGRMDHIELVKHIREIGETDLERYYYCIRDKSANCFYEFYMCQFDEIVTDVDDYVTISSRGVTHFVAKEAEFLTLSDWVDEVDAYRKIHQIKFFKNFSIGKCYALWKKLVKSTKTMERGSYLGKELYQADTSLNKYIIGIRKLIYTLQQSDMIQVILCINLS